MTPFPHPKEANQEAGGNPGVGKFQRKFYMNFKGDFFLGHPVIWTRPERKRFFLDVVPN